MPEKIKHITNFSLNKKQLPALTAQEKKRLDQMTDEDIDYSEIPELDDEFWKKAKIIHPQRKAKITIRLDQSIIDWFKKEGKKGYQTKINTILKSYIRAYENQ